MKFKKILRVVALVIAISAATSAAAVLGLFFAAFYGGSPLHYAAATNNMSLAKISLALGANINTKRNAFKDSIPTTALEWASEHGSTQVATFLLEKGANPVGGRLALGLAAREGNLTLVQYMLEHRVDPNLEAKIGITALDYLITQNGLGTIHNLEQKERILRLLIAKGADVNHVQKSNGWTPLYQAAFYACPSFFKILLEHGANPDAVVNGKSIRVHVDESRGQWPATERQMIADILQKFDKDRLE
ncbi:MAG: ankyrin repeat domain-containing protein [Alphaproteobacteria bacterium]|jgi:ankyrin repeat protein